MSVEDDDKADDASAHSSKVNASAGSQNKAHDASAHSSKANVSSGSHKLLSFDQGPTDIADSKGNGENWPVDTTQVQSPTMPVEIQLTDMCQNGETMTLTERQHAPVMKGAHQRKILTTLPLLGGN
jgi:hypothetical protein